MSIKAASGDGRPGQTRSPKKRVGHSKGSIEQVRSSAPNNDGSLSINLNDASLEDYVDVPGERR